jgi:hypothetical protein
MSSTIRRAQGPITAALCWAHARRQFFKLADIAASARRGKNAAPISPIARSSAPTRCSKSNARSMGKASRSAYGGARSKCAPRGRTGDVAARGAIPSLTLVRVAEPIDYMLRRWDRFTRFIDDGRICLTNNAAERALRGFALGRRSWLFAGSERGAERAAVMATLIMTRNSTMLIHRHGSLMCSHALLSTSSIGSTSCCRGIGVPMAGLSRHLKQLEQELLALGEETMLIELDRWFAGLPRPDQAQRMVSNRLGQDSDDPEPTFDNLDHVSRGCRARAQWRYPLGASDPGLRKGRQLTPGDLAKTAQRRSRHGDGDAWNANACRYRTR